MKWDRVGIQDNQAKERTASHARCDGGTIEIYDPTGKPFKTIRVKGDQSINDGYIPPSL